MSASTIKAVIDAAPRFTLANDTAIVGFSEFIGDLRPAHWVLQDVLQQGYLYALTAYWGHGKTAVILTLAAHVASGQALGTKRVHRCKVLVLCGENVDDSRVRVAKLAEALGIDAAALDGQMFFTKRPFAIDDPAQLAEFVGHAKAFGPFGLAVIDTGPAHSAAEEENDNREMHRLAMAMREFKDALGNPATVALMHPAKGAQRDTMQPRGGGAFSGNIDGELVCWRDKDVVEFFHRTKFRGKGFDPMRFDLARFAFPDLVDNLGQPTETVVAVPTDKQPEKRRPALSGKRKIVFDQLLDLMVKDRDSVPVDTRKAAGMHRLQGAVTVDKWRRRFYSATDGGASDANYKAFSRAVVELQADRLVGVFEGFAWVIGQTE